VLSWAYFINLPGATILPPPFDNPA